MGGRTSDVTLLSQATPVVFVVNDDVSLREPLEQRISRAGWKAETFESAMEVPGSPSKPRSELPDRGRWLPELSGLELQKRIAADRIDMPRSLDKDLWLEAHLQGRQQR